LVEGDAFNRVLIDRSERFVKALGFFTDVTIEEEPGTAPDRSILNVNVEEQPTGNFQIGGGVSSNDNYIFNISIEERNLLGSGKYVLLDLQAAQRTNRARLSITEPWFLNRRLQAGASITLNSTDFEEAGFVSDSIGFNTNIGFRVSEFDSLLLNYGLRRDNLELTVSNDFTSPNLTEEEKRAEVDAFTSTSGEPFSEVNVTIVNADGSVSTVPGFRVNRCVVPTFARDLNCDRDGRFLTSQLGYTLRMDRTNDPIVPTKGWDLSFSQSFAGLIGNVNFHRSTLRGGVYQRLPFKLIGALKVNAGYIDSFDESGVRTNDRFFLGGNRGFRGFDVAGVGPRLFGTGTSGNFGGRGQALGARAYAIASAEALLPLPIPPSYGLRASLFVDAGYVGLTNDRDQELFNEPFEGDLTNPEVIFDENGDIIATQNLFGPSFPGPNDPGGAEFYDFIEVTDESGTVSTQAILNDSGIALLRSDFADFPLQDDFAPRVTAGLSINWNSPFGPIQIDFSEALVVEPYDRPQSFRFSAGGRF
ncbi:MAG: BamA/TamA family outer membrane protein, partial [Pseudomonadota bacterium]